MKEYCITQDAPADGVVRLEDIFGQVQLADTIVGKMYQELLETGAALKMKLVPYGFGTKNDKGEITEFKLSGFKVVFEEDGNKEE